jgi:hypothetical protein
MVVGLQIGRPFDCDGFCQSQFFLVACPVFHAGGLRQLEMFQGFDGPSAIPVNVETERGGSVMVLSFS